MPWTIAPLGHCALLVTFGDRIDPAINEAVHASDAAIRAERIPGIHDLVPAYATLAIHFDPAQWDSDSLTERVRPILSNAQATKPGVARLVTIPVRYGGDFGPDLGEVATHCGLSPDAVIARHSATEYRVMFLGFSPGFAYMAGLDPALATPRRTTPRRSVPAGSVGIGGAQTGIYPSATPGGWQLLGRTGLCLFDPERDPPCALQPGDRVRFSPVEMLQVEDRVTARHVASGDIAFRVEHPGLLSTIQDLGRFGWQHLGIGPGGAADTLAHRAANRLVGNDAGAATIEMTIVGARLIATRATTIAIVGGSFAATIDALPCPIGRAVAVTAGAHIDVGPSSSGARAYFAVAGGFDVPQVLGSRSTALRDRFGGLSGRALRKGDELSVGESVAGVPVPGVVVPVTTSAGGPIRVLPGPQWEAMTAASRDRFVSAYFMVTVNSDRMGIRLGGQPLALQQPLECLSAGVATGTIQLPPDGQPIVLLADRQTTGGYPRIGDVISADLPRLAQLRPGDTLTFAVSSMSEARQALGSRL